MKLSRPLIVGSAVAVALAGAAVAGMVAHAGAKTTTVKITEREYKITFLNKAKLGADRFVIKNTGRSAHALSISGPGVKKRTPMIRPGKSAVLLVTLRAGKYSVWCPVPGHAALGMKTSFKLGTTSTGGGGSSTGGTTSSGTTTSGNAWG